MTTIGVSAGVVADAGAHPRHVRMRSRCDPNYRALFPEYYLDHRERFTARGMYTLAGTVDRRCKR